MGFERDGNKGNLILEFNINNMDELTPEQIEKIKDIL